MRLYLTAGYYLHQNHISGMLRYALDNIAKPRIASSEFAEALGISPRNVEGLRVVLVSMGLLNSTFTLSLFGRYVALRDPFFDNLATLWIAHYNVSADPENYVWHRFTKKVLPSLVQFSREDVYGFYSDVTDYNKGKSAHKTMHKEVVVVLDAYSVRLFKNLNFILKENKSRFIKTFPAAVDPMAFLYSLLAYMENKKILASALTIPEIITDPDSPASLFFLDEIAVNEILNRLHSRGLIGLEKFADLNQVRFPNSLTKENLLNEIYGSIA